MVWLEQYQRYVTKDGLVYRKSGDRLVLCKIHQSHGYPNVSVYPPTAHRSCINVHRLVALAFCDNPNGFVEVDHIDRNKQNCSRDNLRWCDRQTNNLNKPCCDTLRALGIKSNTPEYFHYWYEQNKERLNKRALERYYARKKAVG